MTNTTLTTQEALNLPLETDNTRTTLVNTRHKLATASNTNNDYLAIYDALQTLLKDKDAAKAVDTILPLLNTVGDVYPLLRSANLGLSDAIDELDHPTN